MYARAFPPPLFIPSRRSPGSLGDWHLWVTGPVADFTSMALPSSPFLSLPPSLPHFPPLFLFFLSALPPSLPQAITDPEAQWNRMVELNVQEQCINLFANPIVQVGRREGGRDGWREILLDSPPPPGCVRGEQKVGYERPSHRVVKSILGVSASREDRRVLTAALAPSLPPSLPPPLLPSFPPSVPPSLPPLS